MTEASALPDPASLLEEVLGPLLADFSESFERGLMLVKQTPERVMPAERRYAFRRRLEQARGELNAARALRAATPAPMALEMATIAPWHELLVEVWSLSSALRAAGCHPEQGTGAP